MSKVTVDEINEFLVEAFPKGNTGRMIVTHAEKGLTKLYLPVTAANGRPGGYISGPTQMSMADAGAYTAIFTEIGIVPMAVTSNLNIDFLRPCIGEALIGEAKVVKFGKTLAVINVIMHAEGEERISSQATVTYAIPQATI